MKKIIVSALFIAFFLSGCKQEVAPVVVQAPSPDDTRVQSLYAGDERMWEHIFNTDEPYDFENAPLGVIMPHHLVAAFEIARFYAGLSKVMTPSTIFILSPNHYEVGDAPLITCKTCIFETTYGDVDLDDFYTNKLVDDGIAKEFDQAFEKEHGIFAHTPFIKNYFPSARVVPILIDWQAPNVDIMALVDWLDKYVGEDDLVIASVDFSHYQPWPVAEFHDRSSFASITNFDFENIYDLEIDSPLSVMTLMKLMERRGYMKAKRYDHTNNAQFITKHTDETTSHQFFAFHPGDVNTVKGVGMMSFGNMPAEHTLNFGVGWNWNADYKYKKDQTTKRMLKNLAGKEDRFLVGTDYLVFDLEEDQCRIEKQNGLSVAFCKFVEDDERSTEYLNKIKEIDKEADLVYLMFEFKHGGTIDENRKYLIRDFAKKGVDIFIGSGLDKVVPMAVYKHKLLIYSLGEFIKDNKLVSEINDNGSGLVLGTYVTPDDYTLYLFPVDVENGYPQLKEYMQKKEFFKWYIDSSDLPKNAEIDFDRGIIKIDR